MRYQDTKELLEAECDEHRDLRIKSARLRQDFATVQQDNAALRYYYSRLHKDLSTQLQNVQDARRQDEAARCEEEERVMRVVLDWETRSRIAQGLNDLWAFDDSIIENYTILKNGGFTYLPHILAIWAVKKGREPAQSLFNMLDSKDVTRMQRKADSLENKGLGAIVDEIWAFISDVDRSTMIKMYLSTRSHPRTPIARPSPSMSIGKCVIESDSRLSTWEKVRAGEMIETAVDSDALPLFSE